MKKQNTDEKMTLKRYYGSLPGASAPKTEFVNQIVARCGVTIQCVHRWLKGYMPAAREHCDVVAEITGVPVEELFPLYNEKFLTDEKH